MAERESLHARARAAPGLLGSLLMDTRPDGGQCPLGRFPCGNVSVCLPQLLQCNGAKDCKNGADEENCVDDIGWPMLLGEMLKSNKKRSRNEKKTANCIYSQLPRPSPLTAVLFVLSASSAPSRMQLPGDSSTLYRSLKKNQITSLLDQQFTTYARLEKLILANNNITQISPSVFVGLKSLLFLDLHNNALSALPKTSICAEMPKLNWLDLEGNLLHIVQRSDFHGCNQITVLDLSSNQLKELLPSSLKGLQELQQLNISNNPLHLVFPDEFDYVPRLRSLSIEGLEIPNIHSRMFEKLTDLSHIYLKKFHYCSFAPHVRRCKPHTDGISSLEHLLASLVLRISVWLIACLTCFGNIFVICLRSFVVPESSKHAMAVKSLCFADCLTGVYLFLLGIFDLTFSGEYNQHARAWVASLPCQLAGGLAMLSSEVSVLLLTYMTLEKYLCIVFPFSHYGAGRRRTLSNLAAIWLLGFSLALVPFLAFKNYYGTNGVCFPLHSDGTESWAARGYSAGIFLGLNLIAFICVVCAYTHMFYSVHTSAARTAECNVFSMDVTIAKRFFFIVFTNALCWIPIFILKLLSLLNVDIPGTVTSWVVIFILPINSALNPILYTITTSFFQEKFKQYLQKNRSPLQETQGTGSIAVSSRTTRV
ncbi:relaxin receptor 1-like [Eublepharis macularius]|uniref:Relaxin receptor 1-like n=1 Tax=Eublepharis macularius TaxID=481883 RepID=A0AA97LHP3_EUBMA|nr:relaxin receptor 1-like [Eublepharis macularius]